MLLTLPVAGTRIEPDPFLAPLVAEAFRLAAEGMAVRNVLAEQTPKGIVSRNGRPMGPSGLWSVLANPFYAGHIRYKGELIKGGHVPLVDGEKVHLVQRQLTKRRRTPGRKH